jgi:pimeloyl-ACP methyl ester carboxylesterase
MVGISEHDVTGAGTVPFRGGHTWYRVIGDLPAGGPAPLLLLHGGPGAEHNSLLPLADLFSGQRPVVLYDQVGCGNSTPRPDWPPQAWTVELHLEELDTLVTHLGLSRFHLLGHSWGGFLAAEYALAEPGHVASLTLFSSAASSELMTASVLGRIKALAEQGVPPEEFATRHLCRVPMPEPLLYTFAQLAEHPEVNTAMAGSDENTGELIGTLRGWSAVRRLAGIAAPTLVLGGEFDELDAAARQPFLDLIPDVRGHEFAGASHVAYIETPEAVRGVLGAFLAEHDPL